MPLFRQVSERAKKFLASYDKPSMSWRLGKKLTFVATALFSKSVIKGLFDTHAHNLDILHEAYKQSKIEKRGLLTVMNHTSVVDEPLCWGILPFDSSFYPHRMRWTLGAENICFYNAFLARFFSLGQVLSTKRFGAGPFQGSIDAGIYLLSRDQHNRDAPEWVHTFPESVVHQPYPPYENTLRYFKWGVSRLVLESDTPPIIVPIFTKGLEHAMPEGREDDGYLPASIQHKVEFNVGQPMDPSIVQNFRDKWVELVKADPDASLDGDMTDNLKYGAEAQALRSKTAEAIRDAMVQNARSFFSDLPKEQDRFKLPSFWASSSRDVSVRKREDEDK